MKRTKKRFLVTGLCISRNLGGPAMALTLRSKLQEFYPDCEVRFAVSAEDFEAEDRWAGYYDIQIVRRDSLNLYPLNRLWPVRVLKKLRGGAPFPLDFWREVHREYMQAFEQSDVVIAMEGISYVGDGSWSWRSAVDHLSSYWFARQHRKPYCRFVQSFGPFGDWRVRALARYELRRLPCVFARGRHTAEYCRELLPRGEIHEVPDIAILLPRASDEWGRAQLAAKNLEPLRYTVISPSAVIVNTVQKHVGGSVGEKHVESMVLLAKGLLQRGHHILFLPHMYSSVTRECDRNVCRTIIEALPSSPFVHLVEQDLDPMQAKWLIGHARQAVVARYHALVAAVSSFTPVVAVGWNVKYRDLLEYYGMGDQAIDARQFSPVNLTDAVLERLETGLEEMRVTAETHQRENEKTVLRAFGRLRDWIDHGT